MKDLNLPGEAKVLLDGFSNIHYGEIILSTPEGQTINFTGKSDGHSVSMNLMNWDVLTAIFNKSDIGLAETYIKGDWSVSSIEDLIELAILNKVAFAKAFKGNWAQIIFYKLRHLTRENTKRGSKKNIKAHYDLGNLFYNLWLDKTMSYSSALYITGEESFEEAQLNKYQSMLDLIDPRPGDHILEIGCGWGGFLEFAGKKGYFVTGITISDEQFLFAKERIKKLNLENLVEVKLCDYRDINGQYDHAVSIEMIEAVGAKHWKSYFNLFKKVLKPGGKFSIQAIVINDQDFANYRRGTDFIQQYIFPGGMLLSPQVITSHLQDQGYELLSFKNFGMDYAKTLNIWKQNFNAQITEVKNLNFDDKFIRLWNFYLGYCEGAFKAKRIDVVQFSAVV